MWYASKGIFKIKPSQIDILLETSNITNNGLKEESMLVTPFTWTGTLVHLREGY